jgi:hypothetical protein
MIAQWYSAGLWLDDRGFESWQELGIFTSPQCRLALGPTQPPIQWVPGLGEKLLGHEADHSHPSSAEVKNAWSYTSTPLYAFMTWCSVKKSTGTSLPLLFMHCPG